MTDFSIGGCNVRHVRFQFDRSAVVIRRRAANWYHLDFSNAHSNPARPRGNPAPAEGDRAAYWRQALIPGPAVVRVAWTCSVSYYLDHDVPPQHRCAARGWLRAAVWCRHDPAASCARRADVSRLARRVQDCRWVARETLRRPAALVIRLTRSPVVRWRAAQHRRCRG